ncbi:hypothetical protein [Rhizobium sp. BK176]|uniref:hypothetical protein n=1 Tax=Rhizobium sp. BK176 TaxID=2587071 RepID=UPI002169E9C2|nr:hypothetical protein [Rhizobium sp. BK176]MCS4089141.1 hypothetical protein [Rhizobium sp. BK176]
MTALAKFTNAIETGRAAARNAGRALSEIDGIFDSFKKAMREVSEGHVFVSGLSVTCTFMERKSQSLDVSITCDSRIVAKHMIGRVVVSSSGYPVMVTDNDGTARVANNAEELEESLALLCHSHDFGRWYEKIHTEAMKHAESKKALA